MNSYVAMLRGINVSGRNKVKMDDLRELVTSLGFSDVRTYIQSGNIIFANDTDSPSEITGQIEGEISRRFGLDVAVVLRTRDDLAEIVENNPFLTQGADPAHLHVTFLAEAPDRALIDRLDIRNVAGDEYRLRDREIYLYCPQGYGQTKLTNAFWERRLHLPTTTRNWNTITTLLKLAGG